MLAALFLTLVYVLSLSQPAPMRTMVHMPPLNPHATLSTPLEPLTMGQSSILGTVEREGFEMVDMPKIKVTLIDSFGNPADLVRGSERRLGAIRVDLLLKLHEDPRQVTRASSSSNEGLLDPWVVSWEKVHLVHSNTLVLPPAMTLQALLEKARAMNMCADREGYDLFLACRQRMKKKVKAPKSTSNATGGTSTQAAAQVS
jgi:hypothetical protein